MKKHNLYFEIKKNLVFSQLSFLYQSFYELRKWIEKLKLIWELIISKSNKVD